jgi:hypothetical protein
MILAITARVQSILQSSLKAFFLAVFFLCAISVPAGAVSYPVERSTANGETLASGTIVVAADSPGVVRPARIHEGQYLFGVVTPATDASVASSTVGVASSGVISALVSDMNGQVKRGDRITISSIAGVAMKATESGWMVGIAQSDFTASSRAAIQEQVVSSSGEKKTVSIKELPVLFSVSYYNADSNRSGIEGSFLGSLEAVAGRTVSPTRASLAVIVFAVAMILLVTLVYGSVNMSIVSIGRNPLAHVQIVASLVKVLVTTVVVIVVALAVIYLILKV